MTHTGSKTTKTTDVTPNVVPRFELRKHSYVLVSLQSLANKMAVPTEERTSEYIQAKLANTAMYCGVNTLR